MGVLLRWEFAAENRKSCSNAGPLRPEKKELEGEEEEERNEEESKW